MAISDQKAIEKKDQEKQEKEQEEDYSEGETEVEEDCSDDSEEDPTFDVLEETRKDCSDDSEEHPTLDVLEETRSSFSKLAIKKSRSRIAKESDAENEDEMEFSEVKVPELDEKDAKSFEEVEKLIHAGQIEKLKVDQCKVYLRKYGLRLTGKKEILLERIKEHLEVINGGGEKKYPVSSFVLNCTGDACNGDVVMFEQKVYEMYSIVSRSATPCGARVVAGRIVKESYGAAKQQHTFTIEVLWSRGEKPLPPLHPLLIKGRNLYRLKTMRQKWADEGERRKVLLEKHSRGSLARSTREARIQAKESRMMLNGNRTKKRDNNKNREQIIPAPNNQNPQNPHQSQAPVMFQAQNPGDPTLCCYQSRLHQNRQFPSKYPQFPEKGNPNRSQIPVAFELRNPGYPGYPPLNSNPQVLPPQYLRFPISPSKNHQFSVQPHSTMNGFYRRPLTNLNSPPWLEGHPQKRPMQSWPCRFYTQGRCHYGDACKYRHE